LKRKPTQHVPWKQSSSSSILISTMTKRHAKPAKQKKKKTTATAVDGIASRLRSSPAVQSNKKNNNNEEMPGDPRRVLPLQSNRLPPPSPPSPREQRIQQAVAAMNAAKLKEAAEKQKRDAAKQRHQQLRSNCLGNKAKQTKKRKVSSKKAATAAKKAKTAVEKTAAAAAADAAAPARDEEEAPPVKIKTEEEYNAALRKAKGKNYAAKEDEMLARAFVNISQDAIVGADQTKAVFWEGVKAGFDILVAENNVVEAQERSWSSLKSRWTKKIQPDIIKWNRFFKIMYDKEPSGRPLDELYDMATERMEKEDKMGKTTFLFQFLIPIVHQYPKLNPLIVTSDDEESDDDDDDADGKEKKVNKVGGGKSTFARPIGTKNAKRLLGDDTTYQTIETSKIASYDKIGQSTDKIAAALEKKNRLNEKKHQLSMMTHYEHKFAQESLSLLNQARTYQSLGMMEKARTCMEELEELKKAHEQKTKDLEESMMNESESPVSLPQELITDGGHSLVYGMEDCKEDDVSVQ
jgi:hypothetical protein